jgi:single-strand DNA-binding protein
MSSVNKVILVGNLGRDPEVRSFQNGGKVAELRIATSETWKDRESGERKEKTEWHTVQVFGEGLVGVVERFVTKGTKLYVEGQIQTRKYQGQDGQDKYTTEIVLKGPGSVLTMMSGKGDGDGSGGGDRSGGGRSSGGNQTRQQPPRDDFDDDVPF